MFGCMKVFFFMALQVATFVLIGTAPAQSGRPQPQQLTPAQQAEQERQLRAFANRGDADAQFELGLRYLTGEGFKKDEKKGVEWLEKAALSGHLRAQFVYGSLFEDGVTVPKDPAKAVEWYLKAANGGFPMAQHSVGVAYELGQGVPKDTKLAAEWFEKAAAQNYPPAMSALGSKLEKGEGLPKNTARAALLFLKASKQEFEPAMGRMAHMYYTGTGVPVDYRRSFGWYQRAARTGDAWSANDLAWFLSTCPDESLHNGEQAVLIAKEALKILAESGSEERHEMLDTVAAALARNGEYGEAVLWQKKAITLLAEDEKVTDEERQNLKDEFEGRLKLYQKQSPYTEPQAEGEKDAQPLPQDTILQEEGIPDSPSPQKKNPSSKKPKGTVV
jgi:TPR repeat protein